MGPVTVPTVSETGALIDEPRRIRGRHAEYRAVVSISDGIERVAGRGRPGYRDVVAKPLVGDACVGTGGDAESRRGTRGSGHALWLRVDDNLLDARLNQVVLKDLDRVEAVIEPVRGVQHVQGAVAVVVVHPLIMARLRGDDLHLPVVACAADVEEESDALLG